MGLKHRSRSSGSPSGPRTLASSARLTYPSSGVPIPRSLKSESAVGVRGVDLREEPRALGVGGEELRDRVRVEVRLALGALAVSDELGDLRLGEKFRDVRLLVISGPLSVPSRGAQGPEEALRGRSRTGNGRTPSRRACGRAGEGALNLEDGCRPVGGACAGGEVIPAKSTQTPVPT